MVEVGLVMADELGSGCSVVPVGFNLSNARVAAGLGAAVALPFLVILAPVCGLTPD